MVKRRNKKLSIVEFENLELFGESLLFDKFYILGHYVIAFGTMSWKLVGLVSLEYIGSSLSKINYDLKLTSVSCKVE